MSSLEMIFCGFGADLNLVIIRMERLLVISIFCCCVRQYQNKCAVIITDCSFTSAYSRSDKLIELSVTTNKELYIFFGYKEFLDYLLQKLLDYKYIINLPVSKEADRIHIHKIISFGNTS